MPTPKTKETRKTRQPKATPDQYWVFIGLHASSVTVSDPRVLGTMYGPFESYMEARTFGITHTDGNDNFYYKIMAEMYGV